jgi:hypothetical protein
MGEVRCEEGVSIESRKRVSKGKLSSILFAKKTWHALMAEYTGYSAPLDFLTYSSLVKLSKVGSEC